MQNYPLTTLLRANLLSALAKTFPDWDELKLAYAFTIGGNLNEVIQQGPHLRVCNDLIDYLNAKGDLLTFFELLMPYRPKASRIKEAGLSLHETIADLNATVGENGTGRQYSAADLREIREVLQNISRADLRLIVTGLARTYVEQPSVGYKTEVAANIVAAKQDEWLEELIEAAYIEMNRVNPYSDLYKKFCVPQGVPLGYFAEEPFNTLWTLTDQVFIDRDDIRTELRRILAPFGGSVLVVSGERRSGRSYIRELIAFEKSRFAGTLKVASYDLATMQATPEAMVRSIASSFGLEVASMPTRNGSEDRDADDKLVPELADWLVRQVVKLEQTQFWIVVDAFDSCSVDLSPIDQLVLRLADKAHHDIPNLKVVLLAYHRVPPAFARLGITEKLQTVHIQSFFQRHPVCGELLRDELVSAAVESVWNETPDPKTCEALARKVKEKWMRISGGAI